MLTQQLLKKILHYDSETGIFTWKKTICCKMSVGKVAGSNTNGYLEIGIYGKSYKAHRLAWLYVYGIWPSFQIDHIDHQKKNNAINNLREVTQGENNQNQSFPQKTNTTGFLGVSLNKSNGKYRATISVCNKTRTLGHYKTPEEAYAAYVVAKRKLHSTCTL